MIKESEKNVSILSEIIDWNIDAKLDADDRYFYPVDEVQKLIDGRRSYLIGRKGTGKTAIANHIARIYRHDLFVTKLTFKNFPFNILYEMENSSFRKPNQYISAWKYIIYLTVCQLMSDNNAVNGSFRENAQKLFPKFGKTVPQIIIDRLSKLSIGINYLGTGGNFSIDLNKTENKFAWIDNLSAIEGLVLNFIDDCKYIIVFDELDEDYRNIDDAVSLDRYNMLITGLFKAVQDIRSIFISSGKNILPIICLRDDIYDLITDPDKNKWRDLKIDINWDKSRIKNLLEFRINNAYKSNAGASFSSFDKAWLCIFRQSIINSGRQDYEFFGTSINTPIHSFKYIENYTHLRPRDFIQFIKFCSEVAISNKHKKIHQEDLHSASEKYSEYLRDEVIDEIYSIFPQIKDVFRSITEFGSPIFSQSEFAEIIKLSSAGENIESIPKLIDLLYYFNIIGFRWQRGTYFRYLDGSATRTPTTRLTVHRGLRKALRLLIPTPNTVDKIDEQEDREAFPDRETQNTDVLDNSSFHDSQEST